MNLPNHLLSEMKSVFLDKRIFLSTRIKFLEACVRSRLFYSVQAWQLGAKDMQKLEAVCWCFLRRMVKGGFSRRNAPKYKKDKSIPEEEIGWSYKLSNEKIREIPKTNEIKLFCDMQHLKYIAHHTPWRTTVFKSSALFVKHLRVHPAGGKKLSELTILDESQLRRVMI